MCRPVHPHAHASPETQSGVSQTGFGALQGLCGRASYWRQFPLPLLTHLNTLRKLGPAWGSSSLTMMTESGVTMSSIGEADGSLILVEAEAARGRPSGATLTSESTSRDPFAGGHLAAPSTEPPAGGGDVEEPLRVRRSCGRAESDPPANFRQATGGVFSSTMSPSSPLAIELLSPQRTKQLEAHSRRALTFGNRWMPFVGDPHHHNCSCEWTYSLTFLLVFFYIGSTSTVVDTNSWEVYIPLVYILVLIATFPGCHVVWLFLGAMAVLGANAAFCYFLHRMVSKWIGEGPPRDQTSIALTVMMWVCIGIAILHAVLFMRMLERRLWKPRINGVLGEGKALATYLFVRAAINWRPPVTPFSEWKAAQAAAHSPHCNEPGGCRSAVDSVVELPGVSIAKPPNFVVPLPAFRPSPSHDRIPMKIRVSATMSVPIIAAGCLVAVYLDTLLSNRIELFSASLWAAFGVSTFYLLAMLCIQASTSKEVMTELRQGKRRRECNKATFSSAEQFIGMQALLNMIAFVIVFIVAFVVIFFVSGTFLSSWNAFVNFLKGDVFYYLLVTSSPLLIVQKVLNVSIFGRILCNRQDIRFCAAAAAFSQFGAYLSLIVGILEVLRRLVHGIGSLIVSLPMLYYTTTPNNLPMLSDPAHAAFWSVHCLDHIHNNPYMLVASAIFLAENEVRVLQAAAVLPSVVPAGSSILAQRPSNAYGATACYDESRTRRDEHNADDDDDSVGGESSMTRRLPLTRCGEDILLPNVRHLMRLHIVNLHFLATRKRHATPFELQLALEHPDEAVAAMDMRFISRFLQGQRDGNSRVKFRWILWGWLLKVPWLRNHRKQRLWENTFAQPL